MGRLLVKNVGSEKEKRKKGKEKICKEGKSR